MKKLLLLVVAAVVALCLTYKVELNEILPKGATSCEFYIAGEANDLSGFQKSEVGNMTICSSDIENFGIGYDKLGNIIGVAVRYDLGAINVDDILSAANAVSLKVEQGENMVCYYAHSNLLKDSVTVDGKKINLQIAVTQNGIIVGSPMIMGSY